MLDPVELEEMSEIWGTQFADCLITDRRWSTCNQPAAILAAGFVVERAITGIVAILDSGDDFKPYTKMMAETIHTAFLEFDAESRREGTIKCASCIIRNSASGISVTGSGSWFSRPGPVKLSASRSTKRLQSDGRRRSSRPECPPGTSDLTAVRAHKMAQGVVVGFKDDRGFGFIRPDDGGGDVFVHARDIANADKLNQGQRVSFEIVNDDRRGKPRPI